MSKKELRAVKDYWQTPDWLFQNLNERYRFNIDCAASSQNTKCDAYLDELDDYLKYDNLNSRHRCFINPPYSQVDKFISRARYLWLECSISSLSLVPIRGDQLWWHTVVADAQYRDCFIEYYLGRLHFDNPTGSKEKKGGGFFYSVNVIYGFTDVWKELSIDIRNPKAFSTSIRRNYLKEAA